MQTPLDTLKKNPFAYSVYIPSYTKEKMWEAIRLGAASSNSIASRAMIKLADHYAYMHENLGIDTELPREVLIPSVAEDSSGKIVHHLA